jgi:methyl-accepting chemotaxis protein
MLRRLRIGVRLACIALSFGLPMTAALVYVVFRGVQKDIAFGAHELRGTRYQRPLFELLVVLAARPGADDDAAALRAFRALEDVDRELGEALRTSRDELERRGRADATLARLAEQREALAAAAPGAEADEARMRLAGNVNALLGHVGDSSNLILDPDLDSYYLMDAENLALPALALRLQAVRRHVDALAAGAPEAAAALRDEMLLLERNDLPRVAADLRTALAEDAGFYGTSDSLQRAIPPALAAFEASGERLVKAARGVPAEAGPAEIDLAELDLAAEGAAEQTGALWTATVDELDRMLEIRLAVMRRSRTAALGLAAAAAFAASILAAAIARSITRPLAASTELARRVAQGDLRFAAEAAADAGARDELSDLRRALHEMGAGLRRLVNQVEKAVGDVEEAVGALRTTSDEVGAQVERQEETAREIAATAADVSGAALDVTGNVDSLLASAAETSRGAGELDDSVARTAVRMDELAGSIDAIASTIAEMTASVRGIEGRAGELLSASDAAVTAVSELRASERNVGAHAEETRTIAEGVALEARSGADAVTETAQAIEGVRESFARIREAIGALATRGASIREVVSVMDGVAGQTALLSLNASIIAAQAGEHGRSFNVVAGSIRGLADRTSGSSREIGELLASVSAEIERAVEAVAEGAGRVERGTERAEGAGSALARILARCGETAERASDILRAGVAQSERLSDVERSFAAVRHEVHAIGAALQEHGRAAGAVLQTTDNVRSLGEDVKRQTVAQRADVSRAARATAAVSERTREVRTAVDGQREGCAQIDKALGGLRAGGRDAAAAASALQEVISTLAARAERLAREVERFTL